jgi:alkylation response protein AidB-like acyl-CoA dehydrogenase
MTTTQDVRGDVLSAVQPLLPVLAENARAGEQQRWIVAQNVELLNRAGVFQMAVPSRYGGLGLPLADQVRVISAIASACPSTAWVAGLWAGNTWAASRFSKAAQDEIFTSSSVRVSGVFAPTGLLTKVDGGYLLNGSWKWNTGCLGAHWDGLTARVDGTDGPPEIRYAMVPVGELTVLDDWHAYGAAATGSRQTVAKDVFVPAHRTVEMTELLHGVRQPGVTPVPGRDYPFFPYFVVISLGAYPGMARGAMDAFLRRLPGRGLTYTSWSNQSQHPATQIGVARAAGNLEAAEALVDRVTSLMQSSADRGELMAVTDRAYVRGISGHIVRLCRETVEQLYSLSGASAIMLDVPIQRYFRDMQALALHAVMNSDVNAELHGRVLVGLEPGTPFL